MADVIRDVVVRLAVEQQGGGQLKTPQIREAAQGTKDLADNLTKLKDAGKKSSESIQEVAKATKTMADEMGSAAAKGKEVWESMLGQGKAVEEVSEKTTVAGGSLAKFAGIAGVAASAIGLLSSAYVLYQSHLARKRGEDLADRLLKARIESDKLRQSLNLLSKDYDLRAQTSSIRDRAASDPTQAFEANRDRLRIQESQFSNSLGPLRRAERQAGVNASRSGSRLDAIRNRGFFERTIGANDNSQTEEEAREEHQGNLQNQLSAVKTLRDAEVGLGEARAKLIENEISLREQAIKQNEVYAQQLDQAISKQTQVVANTEQGRRSQDIALGGLEGGDIAQLKSILDRVRAGDGDQLGRDSLQFLANKGGPRGQAVAQDILQQRGAAAGQDDLFAGIESAADLSLERLNEHKTRLDELNRTRNEVANEILRGYQAQAEAYGRMADAMQAVHQKQLEHEKTINGILNQISENAAP